MRAQIITWNLWGRHDRWHERENAIIEIIERHRPDVLALQETWRGQTRSQAAHLAGRLGYGHHVQADPPGPDRGLGIISRWPIAQHAVIELPAGGQPTEHRIALHCILQTPAGTLPLYTTHLNWRLDHGSVRVQQLAHITTSISSATADLPAIICGDLNASPEAEEIRMLTGLCAPAVPGIVFQDAWHVAGDGSSGHTWGPATNPYTAAERYGADRIDYVLLQWSPVRNDRIVRAVTLPERASNDVWASDHAAVAAVIEFEDRRGDCQT